MALNWAGAAKGGVSGATGGSALGPWGTIGGGLIGGITGLFGDSGAKNDKLKKVPTGTPEQEALHNNILAQAMGMTQGAGGYNLANQYYNNILGGNQQEAFDKFSQPYLQQFQEQILPQIAERFAGIGGQYGANSGALSSSGFGQALGGASAGLQSQLAQLFSQLQGQAAQQQYAQYNQLSQTGLNHSPFAYTKKQGSMGFGGPLALGISENMEGILNGIASLFKSDSGGGIT